MNFSGIYLIYDSTNRQEALPIWEAQRILYGTGLQNFHASQNFETVVHELEQWI